MMPTKVMTCDKHRSGLNVGKFDRVHTEIFQTPTVVHRFVMNGYTRWEYLPSPSSLSEYTWEGSGLGLTIDMKQEGWDCMVAVIIVGGVLSHLFEV